MSGYGTPARRWPDVLERQDSCELKGCLRVSGLITQRGRGHAPLSVRRQTGETDLTSKCGQPISRRALGIRAAVYSVDVVHVQLYASAAISVQVIHGKRS